mmetsp:Transcript_9729/g.21781  ORF Transcript_9729/g.21781 Transcript_9729/m.21781 type:complete len:170 (+) Transcript_9729:37-546(+)
MSSDGQHPRGEPAPAPKPSFNCCIFVPPRCSAFLVAWYIILFQSVGVALHRWQDLSEMSYKDLALTGCFVIYYILQGISGIAGLYAVCVDVKDSAVSFFEMFLLSFKVGVVCCVLEIISSFAASAWREGGLLLLQFVLEYGWMAYLLTVVWNWVRYHVLVKSMGDKMAS